MQIQDEAKAMVLALSYKAIQLEDIIKWVDGLIATKDHPESYLFDLSLAKTKGDAITVLNRISINCNRNNVARITIGMLEKSYLNNDLSSMEVAKSLISMAVDGFSPAKEAEIEMYAIEYNLELAMKGVFSTPEDIESDLKEFLNKYKG